MKICLITDQHFGVRGDSTVFHDYFSKFYSQFFFPKIEELGIKHVIDLGDTWDKRKFINYATLKASRDMWFDPLRDRNITLDIIVGNHCTAFKNTNEVNSPDLLLREYENVRVYADPQDIEIGGLKIAMLPWICSGNFNQCMDYLDSTRAQILFGHLEIAGFEMYKGHPSDHGFDSKLFSKFDMVFSGHFHHKSTRGNISYLGAPYEMNWSDWNDPRGFHIFDTETRELEFIENPYKMFIKLDYDDVRNSTEEQLDIPDSVSGTYVKVQVKQKTNPVLFDMYIDKLENMGLQSLQINDTHEIIIEEDDSPEDAEKEEDTLSLLGRVVDKIEDNRINKKNLSTFLTDLYHTASLVQGN